MSFTALTLCAHTQCGQKQLQKLPEISQSSLGYLILDTILVIAAVALAVLAFLNVISLPPFGAYALIGSAFLILLADLASYAKIRRSGLPTY